MAGDGYGVAFAGTGGVAEMHAQGFRRFAADYGHLVGAFSRTAENREAFAAKHGIKSYESLDALLADPAVDAVGVLTPAAAHIDTAIACLEAGKHVMCEKPLGYTIADLERMRQAADKSEGLFMPGHNYIYPPAIRRAKEHMDEGRLGKISSVWMIYNMQHPLSIQGVERLVTLELATHHVYTMLYLLGRPSRINAVTSSAYFDKIPDQVMIVGEFPSGAIANLWGCFAANDPTSDPWTVVYKVLGTEGGVSYSWNEGSTNLAPFTDLGPTDGLGWDKPTYPDSFGHAWAHLLNRCLDKGEAPLSTLDDAFDSLRIVEAVERSAEEGRGIEPDYG